MTGQAANDDIADIDISRYESATGDGMRLIELLEQVGDWNDEITKIYVAKPWSCDALAVLVSPSPDTTEPLMRNGQTYDYFMETFLARDFLDDFAASLDGGTATNEQRCQRLVHYAVNDA